MAQYAILKASIQDVIKQNGNNEITGSLLQQSLLAMISSLGDGYQFVGIATLSTNPGMPDQNVLYVAITPGEYVNFDSITVLENEIAILTYNGSWTKNSINLSGYFPGYQFIGFAEPNTVPDQNPKKVFYLASQPGNYVNFGHQISAEGIYVLYFNGDWKIRTIFTVYDIPTDLMNAIGIVKNRGAELPNSFIVDSDNPTYPGTYLDAAGYIGYTSSGRYVTAYPVKTGQKINIYGNTGSGSFGACGFTTETPELSAQVTILSLLQDNIDIDFVAPEDGWVLVYHRSNSEYCLGYNIVYESNHYTKDETDEILDQLLQQMGADRVRGNELQNGSIVPGASESTPGTYLQTNGVISSTTSGRYLKAYPVTAGQRIIIYGQMGSAQAIAACGFSTIEPAVGVSGITVIEQINGEIDLNYTVREDGWILVYHRSNSEYCIAYEERIVIAQGSELYGKTIAILGDSIMQYMGGPLISGNSITLRNYDDPTDPMIYQQSEATIVSGIIYLTSSLNDGIPDENSIRLEIINSKQDEIDNRGWDYLRAKLGAKRVVNCAQGGGRIPEMGIVTKYPSLTIGNEYDGKLQSLPNQVRMLIRMADSEIIDSPDCIVIWMGVNGTTQYNGDMTFDDAMEIPWSVLSDDVDGYAYRSVFFGALRYAIEALYRAFPYANICVISPIQNNRGDERINNNTPAYRGFSDLKATAENMKVVAQRYACIYFEPLTEIGIANFSYKADTMDGTNEISTGERLGNLIPTFIADGLHPNAAGNIVLANYLAKKIYSFYFSKK